MLPKYTGILIIDAPGNLIGGAHSGDGNSVVAAKGAGILISGDTAQGNQVINNTLGRTSIASSSSENLSEGIVLGSSRNEVSGNSISNASHFGIKITLSAANRIHDNQIYSNRSSTLLPVVGVGVAGESNVIVANLIHDNVGNGIDVSFGATNLVQGNIIYDNVGIGVTFSSTGGSARLSANSIYQNNFGISLSDRIVPTPNDFGDHDTGPNGLQNFPTLDRPEALSGGFSVTGGLSTNLGSRVYHLEFFANNTSPVGFGEGERFLGSLDTTTNPAGEASFSFGASVNVQPGEFITATATDPDGNTSEFSKAIQAGSGNDTDADGIDNGIEDRVPNRINGSSYSSSAHIPHLGKTASAPLASGFGDGNDDGIQDSQQNNVASFLGVTGKWLTLAAPTGLTLKDVLPGGPPDFTNLPAGYSFPAGFVGFTATGLTPGGSVTITNILHETLNCTTVFAYGPTPDNNQSHWYEFRFDGTTGAQMGKNEIALTFKDGSRGDHDLQPNGQITTILAPAAPAALLLNISTRARVLAEPQELIGGFIITGGDSKRVLIRGIGPSLQSFGLQGVLADPMLELHKPDGSVVTNDNWRDTQETELMATGIPPSQDAEAAVLVTLPAGSYTAVLRGKNSGTGIGLVEVYDLSGDGVASELANISARGFVATGDNVMIAGIIIGSSHRPGDAGVVVRAMGPSMAMESGTLQDPTLELHDGNGAVIAFNDNWRDDANQGLVPLALQPGDSRESALYRVLAPGSYTAIVRGSANTTGVGLVEVYHLQ